MRKRKTRTKYGIAWILILSLCLLCLFGLEVQYGPWFQQKEKKSEFNGELFLTKLQEISGLFLQWPTEQWYQEYQKFLEQTQHRLQIETYEFTNPYFKSGFQSLLQQWKEIQIILEDDKYQQYSDPIKTLLKDFTGYENIHFKSDEQMGTTYVHSKITLNEKGAWIQTANLTKSSYESNREHFFYTEDVSVVENLHQVFSWDWEGSPLSASALHPNLVVCPQNCRDVVEYLLQSAKKSLYIQTQYITDPEIREILKGKIDQIELKILVADTVDNTDLVSYFWPGVARKFTPHYNHTKMILVDDTYLLLGSMNLSDNSLDNNREIGIILLNHEHLHSFREQFMRDREKMRR